MTPRPLDWGRLLRHVVLPERHPSPDAEVLAWATGIYEAVKPAAWYGLEEFGFELARSLPKGNLWLLPQTQTRMTYPFVLRWAVTMLFTSEARYGRKADWFLWTDDDVIPPPDAWTLLRAAADPKERPVVAALAYSRRPPYCPSPTQKRSDGSWYIWWDVPSTGTHAVHSTGMTMMLIHRSVFDRVPEPWFDLVAPTNLTFGYGPDRFFCDRLREHGITPHVCCDVAVGHRGDGIIVNRALVEPIRRKILAHD